MLNDKDLNMVSGGGFWTYVGAGALVTGGVILGVATGQPEIVAASIVGATAIITHDAAKTESMARASVGPTGMNSIGGQGQEIVRQTTGSH
jgi:hypothetical protein